MDNDKFETWYNLTIAERGKLINTLLTISIASLGFSISQLLGKDFVVKGNCEPIIILIGCFILLINISVLLFLSVARLNLFNDIAKEHSTAPDTKEFQDIRSLNLKKNMCVRYLLNLSKWLLFIGETVIIIGFSIIIIQHYL